jgi:DNA-binding MarR family transcriptional regulator
MNGSEAAARNAGLEPQQYLILLALRGLPLGREASIRELAERMQLRHHSVVGLVDRLERRLLLRRKRSLTDRRLVIVYLTPRGEKILTRLAKQRIAELRTAAPALVRALTGLIRSTQENGLTPRRFLMADHRTIQGDLLWTRPPY